MPASEPKKLPGIFISYRRSDNPDAVGRIYDRLVSEFGKARVFKDVDSIPLGQDFRGHLNEVVGGCAAVLAIIGPRWTDARNNAGARRLDDPDDFVRIELEAALARNIPVVPVLVAHAPIPGSAELPASLASMAFRQSIEVRPDPDFHHDAARLVSALQQILDPNAPVTDPGIGPIPGSVVLPSLQAKHNRHAKQMTAIAIAAVAVAAALAVPALRHLRETSPPEVRTDIVTPATDLPLHFALSPDGQQIAFVAKGEGASRLWVRSLATANVQPLPGTEGASAPFWSPDGRSIGFFARGAMLRLDIDGNQIRTLAPVGNIASGTWNAEGTILYSRGPGDPLMRVSAAGGTPTQVTELDAGGVSHRVPKFLPDGRRFLFLNFVGSSPGIYLGSLDGGTPVRLTQDVGPIAHLPSGWLLWGRAGALMAQRLDVDKAELTGEPLTLGNVAGAISTANTGLIAYRAGVARQRQLTWMDRSGATLGMVGDPDVSLWAPRVAPDGRRVAVSRQVAGNEDIWLLDGARASRMTFDPSGEAWVAWSPDGSRFAFSSNRSGAGDLYQKLGSGAGTEQLLVASDKAKYASSWSADGQFLLYFIAGANTGADIWIMPTAGDRKPYELLNSSFTEVWGQFSPDGRWVAYQSNESGQDEVYVRAFVPTGTEGAHTSGSGGQWQVSVAGGVHPMWRADGKELYFIGRAGEMMAAPVSTAGSDFIPGAPVRLFATNVVGGGVDSGNGRQYDLARDGRFLINRETDVGELPPITLIQNWNPDAGK